YPGSGGVRVLAAKDLTNKTRSHQEDKNQNKAGRKKEIHILIFRLPRSLCVFVPWRLKDSG
ncbi:MAG TPA: hypothetical protein VMD57_00850, partial [Candidatus Baltobacteraceae bacterium]|nr:hypothetical protein [Candidatus Baltobacteraceae bacterium]